MHALKITSMDGNNRISENAQVLQGQAPAYAPAWGQPQQQAAAGTPYTGEGINVTLALTGISATALPPAAHEAIQSAIAQAVPGVGQLLLHKTPLAL